MFESLKVARTVDKEEYRARVPELREALLEAQFELREAGRRSLLIVLAGDHGAGKVALGNRLSKWMDSRFIETHGFGTPDETERCMPRLWRYWRALPQRGSTGLLYGSWYNDAIVEALAEGLPAAELENRLRLFNRFERMLVQDGTIVVKIWLHSEEGEAERATSKRGNGKEQKQAADPEEQWQNLSGVGEEALEVIDMISRITSTGPAPWFAVASDHARYRDLTVAEMLLETLQAGRDDPRQLTVPGAPTAAGVESVGSSVGVLDQVDLGATMDEDRYKKRLEKQQDRLSDLVASKAFASRSLLVVFEGQDAAGKGGTIRRITESLDPRQYRVHPFSAPNSWEASFHYLWRFWRAVPTPGRIAIFDRSHYGRVLVERIEGLCTPAEWLRAYAEISDFEDQLIDAGTIVVKFWLTISKDEQARRFAQRKSTPHKRHKITDEDWRNRARWDDYAQAVTDMVDRTSQRHAPWHLVSAEDKRSGRVEVLKTLCRAVERELAPD